VSRLRAIAAERATRLKGIVLAAPAAPREAGREGRAAIMKLPLRGALPPEADAALVAEALEILRRMKLRRGRRLRASRRGRLAPRAMLRHQGSTAGVPFVLRYRRSRPRRARIHLVVDVSHSVARAAGVFLKLALGLMEAGALVRVDAFVDRAAEAGAALADRLGAAGRPATPAAWIGAIPGLDPQGRSDYGRAFYELWRSSPRPGQGALLVILGDGRSNHTDPQAWAFEEWTGRYRRVIWLVPEAHAEWLSGDSALDAYLPHVDLAVEVSDLQALKRGVELILR
jgi:uncharacterized protein with von Willebrand factor type A (vWA) domain